jgi:hypothetical protein
VSQPGDCSPSLCFSSASTSSSSISNRETVTHSSVSSLPVLFSAAALRTLVGFLNLGQGLTRFLGLMSRALVSDGSRKSSRRSFVSTIDGRFVTDLAADLSDELTPLKSPSSLLGLPVN